MTGSVALFDVNALPNRRVEDWKYSDLRSALEGANDVAIVAAEWIVGAAPEGAEIFDLKNLDAGAPAWVVQYFGKISEQDVVSKSSLALSRGGIAVRVPKGKTIKAPLEVGVTAAGQGRILIVLEESASFTFIENHAADLTGFGNIGVEIVLGANAQLTHIRAAGRSTNAITVEDLAVQVGRDALYRAHYLNEGGKLSRISAAIQLLGENAQTQLSGVSVLGDGAHADITTHVVHAVGNTHSTQKFKKVAGGKSRAIYQGRVTVSKGANGADSAQTAKALLLGNRAEADLKPELEIFADDVKCAHGAAVGDLDADSLFYLRARGIPEGEARAVLLRAFLEEAVAEISDEAIRAIIWHAVETALPKALAGAA
jgi:Fe-S cluster assembly protein SufD